MRAPFVCILLILTLGGCVHGTRPAAPENMTEGAPTIAAILGDLRANSEALTSLKITGNIRLQLPGEAARQNFRGGVIQFQRPDQFYMRGRKGAFRVFAYAEGNRFLLDLPSEQAFYYGKEGEQFDEIVLDVTPVALLRELFLLEVPGPEDGDRATLESYDAARGEAVVSVMEGKKRSERRERRIRVIYDGGWRIAGLSLSDASGTTLIDTSCEAYEVFEGLAIPSRVTVEFKSHDAMVGYESTRMEYRRRDEPALEILSLDEARAALVSGGIKEVRGVPRNEMKP